MKKNRDKSETTRTIKLGPGVIYSQNSNGTETKLANFTRLELTSLSDSPGNAKEKKCSRTIEHNNAKAKTITMTIPYDTPESDADGV
jgi:hypothetical protein